MPFKASFTGLLGALFQNQISLSIIIDALDHSGDEVYTSL